MHRIVECIRYTFCDIIQRLLHGTTLRLYIVSGGALNSTHSLTALPAVCL